MSMVDRHFVRPDSALVQAADALLDRHVANPEGTGCMACLLPSPCPPARNAVEIRLAAGLAAQRPAPAATAAGAAGTILVKGAAGGAGATVGGSDRRATHATASTNRPTGRRFAMERDNTGPESTSRDYLGQDEALRT